MRLIKSRIILITATLLVFSIGLAIDIANQWKIGAVGFFCWAVLLLGFAYIVVGSCEIARDFDDRIALSLLGLLTYTFGGLTWLCFFVTFFRPDFTPGPHGPPGPSEIFCLLTASAVPTYLWHLLRCAIERKH